MTSRGASILIVDDEPEVASLLAEILAEDVHRVETAYNGMRALDKLRDGNKNLDALGKVDVILVTHGHGDHTDNVAELAKRTGTLVFGPAGLMTTMIDLGWVTPEKGVRFGTGGRVNPLGPYITIT
jgi:glyoxylase-like metal-dependent hydrolase (beta-lactamase superfamily II)